MTQPVPVRDLPPDHREEGDLQRLDFFRKLGFSPGEVEATLRRLGPTTDTNSVLGELVGSKTQQQQAGRSSSPPTDAVANGDQRAAGPGRRPGGRAEAALAPTPSPPPPSPPSVRTEERGEEEEDELKAVVIDGSNVAMSHGNKDVFSCHGILLAVNFFLLRGHTTITVFVPSWRKEQPRPDAQITDQFILNDLEKRKLLVFTPSRRVGGKRVVCYDDRFIVKLAYESEAVIVSNDTYQDLQAERPEWRKCIEERLLMYSFVNNKFMPPDDPLGRHGPSLDNFLRKRPLVSEPNRPLCPYDKKCTYGIKCKFYHPERANQAYSSLADELRERARVSTAKPDRKYQLIPRGPHCDPGPASNPRSLDLETEPWPFLEPRGSAKVTENALICRDGGRTTQNHASSTAAQKDWHGPTCPYSCVSQDSGLGSYESQFSGGGGGGGESGVSPWSRPPQHSAMYLQGPGTRSMCRCCTPAAPPAERYSRSSSSFCSSSSAQPKYDTFPPYAYPPSMHQYYSLPGHPQQGRQQNQNQQHQQPKYWSDPFHELPKAREPCNLSGPLLAPPQSRGPSCAYRENPWAPSQMHSPAFDPDRLDLRKKLHAIFNPYQVDAVMQMFPHLTDAQRLAAEILKFKAQGEVF